MTQEKKKAYSGLVSQVILIARECEWTGTVCCDNSAHNLLGPLKHFLPEICIAVGVIRAPCPP